MDPSAGTTISSYNAFGELTEEIDGNGAVAEYQFDALGRIERINSPDGLAIHNWDSATNGIGKPASSTSADGIGIVYSYDPIGRPSSMRWNVEGTPYDIGYGYDDIGRPSTITYPALPGAPQGAGRLTIAHSYNAQGYVFQIRDAGTDQPYSTAEDRNVAGQLTSERYGNGVLTTNEYDVVGLLRTRDVMGPGAIGRLGQLAYDYDLNRNVISRADLFHGRSDTYAYDELHRLTQWFASNGTTQLTASYDYDSVGKLETEEVQGAPTNQNATYTYGENGAPPHAMTRRNTISYGYDAAGRQTSGPNRTIEYNSWGLPTLLTGEIGEGGPSLTFFAYDAHGSRVLKRDDHETMLYVGGLFERRVPTAADKQTQNLHNIVAEGRVVAQVNRIQTTDGQITNTPVSYLHTDLQGSTTLVTNTAGRAISGFLSELFYDPWGRRIKPTYTPYADERHGGPHEGYTGHEHEDEIGLINMKGRIYDPKTRHFLTPDPFIQAPLFSQSHNRYSYTWNNPATFIDPSGFSVWDDIIEFITKGAGGDGGGGGLAGSITDFTLRSICAGCPDVGSWAARTVGGMMHRLGRGATDGVSTGTPSSDDNNPTDVLSIGQMPFHLDSSAGYTNCPTNPGACDGPAPGFGEAFVQPLASAVGWLMGEDNAWAPKSLKITAPRMGFWEDAGKTLLGAAMLFGPFKVGRVRGAIESDLGESLAGQKFFLHGTTVEVAENFELQAGRSLFTTTDPAVARAFAERTVSKAGGGQPGAIAVVLPRDIVSQLRAAGQLIVRPVSDMPQIIEWVFLPGARETIVRFGEIVRLPPGVF